MFSSRVPSSVVTVSGCFFDVGYLYFWSSFLWSIGLIYLRRILILSYFFPFLHHLLRSSGATALFQGPLFLPEKYYLPKVAGTFQATSCDFSNREVSDLFSVVPFSLGFSPLRGESCWYYLCSAIGRTTRILHSCTATSMWAPAPILLVSGIYLPPILLNWKV